MQIQWFKMVRIKDDCEDACEDEEFGVNDNDNNNDIGWYPLSHVNECSSSNESVDTNNREHKSHLNDDLSRYESNDGDEG